jgi:hypothetical protein
MPRCGKKSRQTVILSAAKNLRNSREILRCAQNDRIANEDCHTDVPPKNRTADGSGHAKRSGEGVPDGKP